MCLSDKTVSAVMLFYGNRSRPVKHFWEMCRNKFAIMQQRAELSLDSKLALASTKNCVDQTQGASACLLSMHAAPAELLKILNIFASATCGKLMSKIATSLVFIDCISQFTGKDLVCCINYHIFRSKGRIVG